MDSEHAEILLKRLRSVEGLIPGIERMVEGGVYRTHIIHQLEAVQKVLDRVKRLIIERHLRTCVSKAVQGDDGEERKRVISEIMQVFDFAQDR